MYQFAEIKDSNNECVHKYMYNHLDIFKKWV